MGTILTQYKIDTADSARTIGQMRTALRDLIGQQEAVNQSTARGRAEFANLQEAINRTEGRVGDLTDSFQTLRGSGVERINASLGLFQQGLANADPGQLTAGLEGLKAAMAAVPIFLVVEGLKYLYENFDKVKEILFDTTSEVEANEYALKALKIQQDANKEALDKYIGSLEKELETLALTDGSLKKQLDLRKEITKVQVGSIDALITAKEKDIKTTEAQIAADSKSLEVQQLQSAQSGAAALQYQTTTDAAQNALKQQLATQQKELQDLKYLAVDRENTIAKGREAEKKLIEDAEKKALEAWQKRQDALDKLIAKRIADRQKALEFEQGGESEIIRNGNEQKLEEESTYQTSEQLLLTQSAYKTSKQLDAARQIEHDNLKTSLNGRIQLINESKDKELATVEAGSDAALIIEQNANQAILAEKLKAANQTIQVAQQTVQQLNSINALVTANENYELNQQQYAKDAAIQNDKNRTSEQLDNETKRTNDLLANDSLTSDQREKIQYDSETRKNEISRISANNELQLQNNFDKASSEIRKKQFERQKKLQIILAIINTASAVVSALGSPLGYPANIVLAAAAGIAGAAQIALIASQKFDDGGSAAKSTVIPAASIDTRSSLPSSSSASSASPGFSPGSVQFDPTKVQNAQGDRSTRVYVLESDITSVQNKVNVIETRAHFR